MKVKVVAIFLVALSLLTISLANAQVRKEVNIPNIPGFLTLKCDFHMHTVFSDGTVWPDMRPEEAWREGLDAISLTEHIEYQPNKDDLPTKHNRAHEIALPVARKYGIHLIRGSEITRDMPPGHINAIFLQDSNPLDTKVWQDAVKTAADQGAFLFWNHPGWRQPNEVPIWYDEHTEMFDKGWVKGMEIVNDHSYYPLAHKWCLEKGITMLGNSDIHWPTSMAFDFHKGEHRAMTLVLAKENTAESIKEALLERRTIVYFNDLLIGEGQYLSPLFKEMVSVEKKTVTLEEHGSANIRIHNGSDVPLSLKAAGTLDEISFPASLNIPANSTVLLRIRNQNEAEGELEVKIPYKVTNMLVEPETGLKISFDLKLNLVKQ